MKELNSKYFTLHEMLLSQTAIRKHIIEQFEPSDAVIDNLNKLCGNILDPIREAINKPVIISSGYRCKRLNKAIGGVPNSQHTEGKAADISVKGVLIRDLFEFILSLNLDFDQIIQEFDSWVHISFNSKGNRKQVLRAVKNGGKTQYIPL